MPVHALAAIVIASIAAMPGNVMPVMGGMLSDFRSLDERALGFVVACGTLAGLVASISAPQWIGRVNVRYTLGIALAVAGAGIVGLRFAPGMPGLFVAQVASGAANVVIASVCLTVIARLPSPARAYGLKTTTDVVFAGTFLAVLPRLDVGLAGFVAALAAASAAAITLVRKLPARIEFAAHADGRSVQLRDAPWSAWLALGTIVVFYVGGIGAWVFLERIAVHANIDRATASEAIAVGLFVGVIGSLGAAVFAGRTRHIWPETLSATLLVAAFVALTYFENVYQFYAAVFVFNAAWNFFVPFVIGQIAARDSTGRLSSLVPGTLMIGGVFGPIVMGILIRESGYGVALTVMTLLVAVSVVGYVTIARAPLPQGPLQQPAATG